MSRLFTRLTTACFGFACLTALSLGALGFAFSDYVEDDLKAFADPLANWLDNKGGELCLGSLETAARAIHWLRLQPNRQIASLPLYRAALYRTDTEQTLPRGADCLYQKTVLRVAAEFPEAALSQPYFFKCALDGNGLRGQRLQFALEPIDEVRFKLHWPNPNATSQANQFSTTLMQQTDASRCQAR